MRPVPLSLMGIPCLMKAGIGNVRQMTTWLTPLRLAALALVLPAMLACQTQPGAPTDTATPPAANGEATQAPARAAETPASTPGATLPPTIAPTPPPPAGGTPTPAVAPTDPPTTESALSGFSWRKDGLTGYEPDALKALQYIEREHPAAAQVVLSYPWVADGITKNDWTALSSLQSISENNATLLPRLVAFPWLANGIGSIFELYAVGYLAQINLEDPSLATRLAGFQWFADTDQRGGNVRSLSHFANHRRRRLPGAAGCGLPLGRRWNNGCGTV